MSNVEETLAWEAEQRPRAAMASVLAGLFTILPTIILVLALRDYPTEDDGFVSVSESISKHLAGQPIDEPSLALRQIEERQDQAVAVWASAIVAALAAAFAVLVLLYLYRAAKARAPEAVSNVPRIAALVALIAYPIGRVIAEGVVLLSDPADAQEARDYLLQQSDDTAALIAELLVFFGTFGLGLAFVLVALNAMRVGLLTRFMGILGIIVGALAVVQLDQPQLIRAFWLVALGGVIAGRVFQRPPAWETGRAQPWPSQQQIREARQQAALGTNVPPSEPDSPAEKAEQEDVAPGPAKRKRKKRR